MPEVQYAVKINAERMGIDPAAIVQYLPVWECGGVRLQDVFRKPDYVVGTDVANYRWSAYGLERTSGYLDPSAGLVKPGLVGGLFTIVQQIVPTVTYNRWYLSNRSEFGFQVQNATLRVISTIRASSANIVTSSISHTINQSILAAMSWDGTTFSAYSDGTLDGTTTPVSPLELQSGQMSLMGNSNNTGSIGSVGAYIHVKQILTQPQIQHLYYAPYTLLMPVARPVYFDLGATTGTDSITGQNVAISAPTVTAPSIAQVHSLTAQNVSIASPTVSSPALSIVDDVDDLTGQNVAIGAPTVTTATLGQIHVLGGDGLAIGAPTVSMPALSVSADTDPLTAQNVAIGSPTVSSTTLGQVHALAGDGVGISAPTVSTPVLGQIHVLTAQNVAIGAPTVNSPSMTPAISLAAQDVVISAPTVTSPTLAQIHNLVGQDVTAQPSVSSPVLGQIHLLVGQGVSISAPIVSTPTLFNADYLPTPRISIPSSVALSLSVASSVCKSITSRSSTGMNVDVE